MSPAPFPIPSVVWYGLAPLLGGVGVRGPTAGLDTGWGGMLTSDDDVRRTLLALDPALVMLNLAGYQAPEIVIGIPAGSSATADSDLVSVATATMGIDRERRGPGSRSTAWRMSRSGSSRASRRPPRCRRAPRWT